jgi:hypothetical protein
MALSLMGWKQQLSHPLFLLALLLLLLHLFSLKHVFTVTGRPIAAASPGTSAPSPTLPRQTRYPSPLA